MPILFRDFLLFLLKQVACLIKNGFLFARFAFFIISSYDAFQGLFGCILGKACHVDAYLGRCECTADGHVYRS